MSWLNMFVKFSLFFEQNGNNHHFHLSRGAKNFDIFHGGVFTTFYRPSKPHAWDVFFQFLEKFSYMEMRYET